MTQLTGLIWFLFMLAPLILLQRLLHREIQAVFLILTRDPRITMGIFSMIFLPGVFLHELSHFLSGQENSPFSRDLCPMDDCSLALWRPRNQTWSAIRSLELRL